MKRALSAIAMVGVLYVSFAVAASGATSGGSKDFTAGGGKAFVQNYGDVKFEVSAHATQEGIPGGARGKVNIRTVTFTLKLDVYCMTNNANFSFIETRDPDTGLFYDVSAIDSGLPGGNGDHFAFSGPWGDPICGGGVAQENSFVTSGNIVVRDGDL